ncbi:hypothetical protein [Aquimarina sp. AU119]|uniref:hypothetical protein n=1 Tax=Aquimarina sp. AU119 TaxID=2108528 RepID=UPI000D693616|nr:hypothetical protein [Aquimarina sp. AU119]
MSRENYNIKLTTLEALSLEEVKAPTIPVDIALQEAENLFVWAYEDKIILESKGLDWDTYFEDLPVRIGACRYAQAVWMKERYTKKEILKRWRTESSKAYEFKNDVLADLYFKFRKDAEVLDRLDKITQAEGDDDIIQDLMDISVLGKSNAPELEKMRYDLRKFNIAEQKSDYLAELLFKANDDTLDDVKAKDLRDRAFTHLKEAIDEIRDTGKYAFRKDPERCIGYVQIRIQEKKIMPHYN